MLRTKGKRRRAIVIDKTVYRINEKIRVPRVMVIDENSVARGEMDTFEALKLAEESGFDLVEVNPKAVPPICKILDYGQFQYQQSRKAQEQRTKIKKVDTKGVRLSYKIGVHDLEFKKDQAIKFLQKGDKVKIEMILKGREKQFGPDATAKLNAFTKSLEESVNLIIECPPKRMGGQIFLLVAPKS